MLLRAKQILLVVLLLLWAHRGAAAHTTAESDATLWVRASGIDVELYMGLLAGGRLIAEDGEFVSITPNNFSDYLDRLKGEGPSLLSLIAADATLTPDAIAVSMTEQNDVYFHLHYPLPAALPGKLKIRAGFLERMIEGHVASIHVMNARGDHLGWGEVRAESPELDARLPAAGDLTGATGPSSTAVAADTEASVSTTESRRDTPWFLWVLLGGSATAIVAVALRGIARQKS